MKCLLILALIAAPAFAAPPTACGLTADFAKAFAPTSTMLIRIYGMDKAFYDRWSCDFLLGECRGALGKESG